MNGIKFKAVVLTQDGSSTPTKCVYIGFIGKNGFKWSGHPVVMSRENQNLHQEFADRNGITYEGKVETANISRGVYCPNKGFLTHRQLAKNDGLAAHAERATSTRNSPEQ